MAAFVAPGDGSALENDSRSTKSLQMGPKKSFFDMGHIFMVMGHFGPADSDSEVVLAKKSFFDFI